MDLEVAILGIGVIFYSYYGLSGLWHHVVW